VQEQRDGGVAHIHRADAAVGIVLLGEKCHLALGRGDKLVRGKGVPPGGVDDILVVLTAGFLSIVADGLIHGSAAQQDLVKVLLGVKDGVGDLAAITAIPCLAQIAEVVDGGNIVIGDDGLRGRTAHGQVAGGLHAVANGLDNAIGAQVQVAPVDRDVVSGVAQRLLGLLTDVDGLLCAQRIRAIDHIRAQLTVIAKLVGQVQLDLHIVCLAVGGLGTECDQCQGHTQQIQIIGQGGSGKGSFELHAAKFADKAGAGGRDFQFGQRGLRLCTLAQKTAGSTVHGQHTADGLGRAAPMAGVGLGHRVSGHPDGKIGVRRHQWDGGKSVDTEHTQILLVEMWKTQPFRPWTEIPSTRFFWKKKKRVSTGTREAVDMANVAP